ncbi:MAG: family 16 glycosylhydrolase [Lautropia sp.]
MQKNTFSRASLASAVLLALAACGSGSGDAGDTSTGLTGSAMSRGDAPGTLYAISTKAPGSAVTAQAAPTGEEADSNLALRTSWRGMQSGDASAPVAVAPSSASGTATASSSGAPSSGVSASSAPVASIDSPAVGATPASTPVAQGSTSDPAESATPVPSPSPAAAPSPAPSPSPSSAAAPSPTPAAAPSPSPAAAPSPTPAASPAPSASPTPAAAPAPVATAPAAPAAGSLAPAGAAAGTFGELTFREEWDAALDAGKWSTRLWYWTTQELDNWKIENGVLKMWTPRDPSGNFEFNNRCMNTDGRFSQRYGWFEMEAKLPPGAGQWPSFWLYAHNDDTRPELDIMEAYAGEPTWGNAAKNPIDYGATVWMSNADSTADRQIAHQRLSQTRPGIDLSAGFHKYGMKWEPDGITYYFDGTPIGPKIFTTEFNQQMYIIVGLGTGRPGGFNAPTAATPTTEASAMEVNYVRAWALPSGTTTGGSLADPVGSR